jgi:hypothetical protein
LLSNRVTIWPGQHITWRTYLVKRSYLVKTDTWKCPSSPTHPLSEQGRFDAITTLCVDDVASSYACNGMPACRYPPPTITTDIDMVTVRRPSHTIILLETRAVWPDLRENSIDERGVFPSPSDDDESGYFSWWHDRDAH